MIRFAGIPDTEVCLQDFALENLQPSTSAAADSGNILFDGQTQVEDSFDVFSTNQQRNNVINAQGWDNTITSLSQDDLLRGGRGFDTFFGSDGKDILRGQAGGNFLDGGEGADTLWGGAGLVIEGSLPRGMDRINDFELGREYIGITGVAGVDEFANLKLIQQGENTLIKASSNLFKLTGIEASTLDSNSFIAG